MVSELSQNFEEGPPSFFRPTAVPPPAGPVAGPLEPVPPAVVAAVAIVCLARCVVFLLLGVPHRASFQMILRMRGSADIVRAGLMGNVVFRRFTSFCAATTTTTTTIIII